MKAVFDAGRLLKIFVLLLLLLVAEFVLPNYVSRFFMRVVADVSALIDPSESQPKHAVIPLDSVQANEFAFEFVPLSEYPIERAAGVLGPDANGAFQIVEQTHTAVAGRSFEPILTSLNAQYPDGWKGGFKQLLEIGEAHFALLGLVGPECSFSVLIDVQRSEIVDKYPCIDETNGRVSMQNLGGGYVVSGEGTLLMALGTGTDVTWAKASAMAQDPASPYGKILRYDIVQEADGPRLENRRVATSGHRNPQGMAMIGDVALAVEHGPKGGDEINLIEEGANYGWPLFSAGSQYNQGDISAFAPKASTYANPIFTFVPSIATSDISTCPSIIASRYEPADCAIVAGLISQSIFIVLGDFASRQVWSVEVVEVGARIREVFVEGDDLYLVPDQAELTRVNIVAFPCDAYAGPCAE